MNRTRIRALTFLLRVAFALAFIINSVLAWTSWHDDPLSRRNSIQPSSFSSHRPSLDSSKTLEEVLYYTNVERQQHRLSDLVFNTELSKAAQRHATDLAINNYFSHTGLDGSSIGDRVRRTNYRYTLVGENLYVQWPDNSPYNAVQGWMNSREHREALLNGKFTEIGLGYAVGQGDKHYYVQVFGSPVESPACSPHETPGVLHQLVNHVRQRARFSSLIQSSVLQEMAQHHALRMAQSGDFSGKIEYPTNGFGSFASYVSYREPFNDPYSAFEGWMDDGVGYLFDPQFSSIGVGYASSGERHYYVLLLGAPQQDRYSGEGLQFPTSRPPVTNAVNSYGGRVCPMNQPRRRQWFD